MSRLLLRYHSLSSKRDRVQLAVGLCESDAAGVDSPQPQHEHDVRDVAAVLCRFVETDFYDLEATTTVIRYILGMAQSNTYWLLYLQMETQVVRAIARIMVSEDALTFLFLSGAIHDYLALLEMLCKFNPQVFMQELCIDGNGDLTALHCLTLLVDRVARKHPELTLELADPLVSSSVEILSTLLDNEEISSVLLHTSPSPLRMLVENLQLMPASLKGVRLRTVRGVIECLVRASRHTAEWLEHFAKSAGPATTTYCVKALCAEREPDSEEKLFAFQSSAEILLDVICLLLALPDNGAPFRHRQFRFFRSIVRPNTELPPQQQWGESVARHDEEGLGLFGFRILVLACTDCRETRPRLFFVLSRLLIVLSNLFSSTLLAHGVISTEVVASMAQFVEQYPQLQSIEFRVCASIVIELYCLCATREVTFNRQEGGANELCKLAVSLMTHDNEHVSGICINALRFHRAYCSEQVLSQLVEADLFKDASFSLITNPKQEHRELLLRLLHEICVDCPPLQPRLMEVASGNLAQVMVESSRHSHSLLPICSNIFRCMEVAKYDQKQLVGRTLSGLITKLDVNNLHTLVVACWALHTSAHLIEKEPFVKSYFRDQIADVMGCLQLICPRLSKLRNLVQEDVCKAYNEFFADNRQRCVPKDMKNLTDDETRNLHLQEYMLLMDVLIHSLNVINITQTTYRGTFPDEAATSLVKALHLGPMVRCRLFSSVVVRSLTGMSCFSTNATLLAIAYDTKRSLFHSRYEDQVMSLQDLTNGWDFPSSVGDKLFSVNEQKIVRPQFLRGLMELFRAADWGSTQPHAVFQLLASTVDYLYTTFQHRIANLYTLGSLNVWDVATEQLVRLVTTDSALRTQCAAVVVDCLRHLGNFGLSTSSVSAALQLTVDRDRNALCPESVADLYGVWTGLLETSLPCRIARQFVALGAGCESNTATSVLTATQEGDSVGGLTADVNYEVWKYATDTHVSAVLWMLVDPPTKKTPCTVVLKEIHFDKSRVVVGLVLQENHTLAIVVRAKGAEESKSKTVQLRLPFFPTRQWTMVKLSVSNFAKTSGPLRSFKLSTRIAVGFHTMLDGVYHDAHTTEEIELSQAFRDKSFEGSTSITKLVVGATTTSYKEDTIPVQLFFGSSALFFGELSAFDLAVLFLLGSDALFATDFLDRSAVIGLYPMFARLIAERKPTKFGKDLSVFGSLWWAKYEKPGVDDNSLPPLFVGGFPFSKTSRDRVVCTMGIFQGEISIRSRVEVPQVQSTPSVFDEGSSNSGSVGSGNSVPRMTDSFAVTPSDRQASNMTITSMMSTNSYELVSALRQKPLVVKHLMLWSDERSDGTLRGVVERPHVCQTIPFFGIIEALGGLASLLWTSSLLEEESLAQVVTLRCVSTFLALHVSEGLSGRRHGGSKRLLLPLLSVMLHCRLGIATEVAQALTECCGLRLVARTDLIPLLIDFSLWAVNPDAMNVITAYLAQLLHSNNPFAKFNAAVLNRRPTSKFSDTRHRVLVDLLFHLHMGYSGCTAVKWTYSTINNIRALLVALTTDAASIERVTTSAVWLSQDDEHWTICLLDAVFTSLTNHFEAQTIKELPAQFSTDLVALLKSDNPQVRIRSLKLIRFVPLTSALVTGVVSEYQARSILAKRSGADFGCISDTELRLLLCAIAGGEAFVSEDMILNPNIANLHDLLPQPTLPLIYVVICLVPCVVPEQQQIICRFLAALVNSGPTQQAHLTQRTLSTALDAPLTSYVLFAMAETFEKSGRSLEVADGACIGKLVELLIELCVAKVKQANGNQAIDTITTCVYSVFNIFVEAEEMKGRSPTPFFRCARRHMIRLVHCSLFALEKMVDTAASALFVDIFAQLLELTHDIVTLVFVPWRADSTDDLTREFDPDAAADIQIRNRMLQCDYISRRNERSRQLVIRKVYAQSLGVAAANLRHIIVDNAELLPIFALQCAASLHAKIQSGHLLCTRMLDKHVISRYSSQLQQQQLKLIAYLLSVRTSEPSFVELQSLAVFHVSKMTPELLGVELQQQKEKKKQRSTAVWRMPGNAQWDVALLTVSQGCLLFTTRNKEPTIALLDATLRLMVSVEHRSQAGLMTLYLDVLRVLFYHNEKAFPLRQELTPQVSAELESLINTCRGGDVSHGTALDIGSRVSVLSESLVNARGAVTMKEYSVRQVNHAEKRALSNLRAVSSYIPLLEDQNTLLQRDNHDTQQHHLQTATFTEATMYTQSILEDGKILLAANASYRFSLGPWLGDLTVLYTLSRTALDRWEVDRFLGPEWERCRMRRYLREPKMLPMEGFVPHMQEPLAFAVMSPADDIELLDSLSINAVPPPVGSSRPDNSVQFTCTLVLPMDRVPVFLTVPDSPTYLTYLVQWMQQSGPTAASETTTRHGKRGGALTTRDTQRTPSNFRYKHEINAMRQVIPVTAIRAVWPRRYMLKPVALEILLDSGETHFFAFESEADRILVQESIVKVAKAFLDRTLEVSEAKRDKWRSWWCDGRVSNFKYLMYLNFMAGRSYGDMRQYPVFPHILCDYRSTPLDLQNPQSFRLLEKPIGAQSQEAEQRAWNRYNALADDGQDPIHYGSHYAPKVGALHYMTRVQPFADYFLHVNSKQDESDRVFDSVERAYSIALDKGFKELIPEFFCFPNLLRNEGRISFGMKQDGSIVDDVQLPLWCDDSRDCIIQLREALECRMVSERLCKWIDLIFGFKQQGDEAISAVNLFHPYTYKNPIDDTTDPAMIPGIETQIENWGQTPFQLFKKNPHKERVKPTNTDWLPSPCSTVRFETSMAKANALLFPEKLSPSNVPPGSIVTFPDFGPINWITFCRTPLQNAGADEFGLGDFFTLGRTLQTYCFPSNVLPLTIEKDTPKDLVVFREHSVTVVDLTRDHKELATLTFHTLCISSCAVVSPTLMYVGTTCGLIVVVEVSWSEEQRERDLLYTAGSSSKESAMMLVSVGEQKTVRIRSATLQVADTLHGHQGTVSSLVVSTEWGMALSVSADRTIAMWDIHRRILIRTISDEWSISKGTLLQHTMCTAPHFFPHMLSVNPKRGDVVVAGSIVSLNLRVRSELRLYSINGERCGTAVMRTMPSAVLAVGPIVFVAEGRTIVLLQSTNLRRRPELLQHSETIVSLSLSPTGNVLAALDDKGNVAQWKVSL